LLFGIMILSKKEITISQSGIRGFFISIYLHTMQSYAS